MIDTTAPGSSRASSRNASIKVVKKVADPLDDAKAPYSTTDRRLKNKRPGGGRKNCIGKYLRRVTVARPTEKRPRPRDQRRPQPRERNRPAIQGALGHRIILQVDQAASEDQTVPGPFRKCSPDSDSHSPHQLSARRSLQADKGAQAESLGLLVSRSRDLVSTA